LEFPWNHLEVIVGTRDYLQVIAGKLLERDAKWGEKKRFAAAQPYELSKNDYY